MSRGDASAGLTAAQWILDSALEPFGPADAAYRAAAALAFAQGDAAIASRELLERIEAGAIDMAFQRLLNDAGANIEVDGDVGPQSVEAYLELCGQYSLSCFPEDGELLRIENAARLMSAANPIRVDVF